MQIITGGEIQRAIDIQVSLDRRAEIRGIADQYLNMGVTTACDFINGMKTAAEYIVNDDQKLFVFTMNPGVVVFGPEWIEESLLQTVNTLKSKKSNGKTPRKTLVKMMLNYASLISNEVTHKRKHIEDVLGKNGNSYYIQQYSFVMDPIDLPNKDSVSLLMDKFKKAGSGYGKIYQKISGFINRDDVDDTIIREAWDLFQIKEVLTE